MKEIQYKIIPDIPGYMISNVGDLINLSTHPRAKKNGTKYYDKDGYVRYWLKINNQPKFIPAHRLVAKAFIHNPENKPMINHKNGIKTDNRVENLEWCTHTENERHARKVLGKKLLGEKASRSKLKEHQVRLLRHMYSIGATNKDLCNIFNIKPAQVSRICLRKNWSHI